MVSIPVRLYSAGESAAAVSFNLLHGKCQSRLKQQYVCPKDSEIVPRDQMVKGYEFAKEQYVVFTSKHHEGFALWDSKVTDFDAKDFTGRDLFKEILEALRVEGLRVGLYFSVIDWHHPDFPVKNTGLPHPLRHERNKDLPDPDKGRVMSRYVDFMHQQAEEIAAILHMVR